MAIFCTYPVPMTAARPLQLSPSNFDEAELANLLLCMCPKSWQDQYNLTQDSLPQSVRKLLGILENVEKVVAIPMPRKRLWKKTLRKPPESARKVSPRVVVPLTTVSLKRCESRKAAHCARNMGACTRPTILMSVIIYNDYVIVYNSHDVVATK